MSKPSEWESDFANQMEDAPASRCCDNLSIEGELAIVLGNKKLLPLGHVHSAKCSSCGTAVTTNIATIFRAFESETGPVVALFFEDGRIPDKLFFNGKEVFCWKAWGNKCYMLDWLPTRETNHRAVAIWDRNQSYIDELMRRGDVSGVSAGQRASRNGKHEQTCLIVFVFVKGYWTKELGKLPGTTPKGDPIDVQEARFQDCCYLGCKLEKGTIGCYLKEKRSGDIYYCTSSHCATRVDVGRDFKVTRKNLLPESPKVDIRGCLRLGAHVIEMNEWYTLKFDSNKAEKVPEVKLNEAEPCADFAMVKSRGSNQPEKSNPSFKPQSQVIDDQKPFIDFLFGYGSRTPLVRWDNEDKCAIIPTHFKCFVDGEFPYDAEYRTHEYSAFKTYLCWQTGYQLFGMSIKPGDSGTGLWTTKPNRLFGLLTNGFTPRYKHSDDINDKTKVFEFYLNAIVSPIKPVLDYLKDKKDLDLEVYDNQ